MRFTIALALVLLAPAAGQPAAGQAPAAPPPVVAPSPSAEHGLAIAPAPGDVTKAFDPPATRFGAGHRGVDIAAERGEPVVAALGGTVTFSGTVANVGWVTIDHGGELNTTYGPISPRLVSAGDAVATGDIIGLLAAGPHLNWGARIAGQYIDPLALLERWETYLTTAEDIPPPGTLAGLQGAAGQSTPGVPRGTGRLRRPAAGAVTSAFGQRRHPVTGEVRLHAGMDIGAPEGSAVLAAAAGTVAFAGTAGAAGLMVIIDHGNGLTTRYAHQSALLVEAGAAVDVGEQIGRVGSTGLSTGPHLHFEVRSGGTPVDPAAFL